MSQSERSTKPLPSHNPAVQTCNTCLPGLPPSQACEAVFARHVTKLESQRSTQEIFEEIDVDSSHTITFAELKARCGWTLPREFEQPYSIAYPLAGSHGL